MIRLLLLMTAACVAPPAAAQDAADGHQHSDHSAMSQTAPDGAPADPHAGNGGLDHSAMDHGSMHIGGDSAGDKAADDMPDAQAGPPPRAFQGPKHAADTMFGAGTMAPSRAELAHMNGGMPVGKLMIDRFEAHVGKGEDLYLWDLQAWHGGDIDRLWLKSEGEGAFDGAVEKAEVQALWSHAIGPWFDLQTGLRYDFEPDSRAHAVLGIQGLAPYMFDVEAAAFLSDRGDLTARAKGEYDQRITQRLVLQPQVELSFAAHDIPERRIGAGLTSLEFGLRLRYEFAREFAPYIGIGYETRLGGTADRARQAGENPGRTSLLVGLRAWF